MLRWEQPREQPQAGLSVRARGPPPARIRPWRSTSLLTRSAPATAFTAFPIHLMVKAHGRGTARRTDYVFTFSPSKRDARKPPPGGEGGKWGSHTPTRDRAVSSGIDLICYGESFYKDLRVDSAPLRHLRMLALSRPAPSAARPVASSRPPVQSVAARSGRVRALIRRGERLNVDWS